MAWSSTRTSYVPRRSRLPAGFCSAPSVAARMAEKWAWSTCKWPWTFLQDCRLLARCPAHAWNFAAKSWSYYSRLPCYAGHQPGWEARLELNAQESRVLDGPRGRRGHRLERVYALPAALQD